jgi:hypothetical protein
LTEVKENRDQLTGIGINLVGKILDAGTATKSQHRAAVTAWNNRATEARGGALFKLFAFRALRLAGLAGIAATALTECTCGSSAATTATGSSAAARSRCTKAWCTATGTKAGARGAAAGTRRTRPTWA